MVNQIGRRNLNPLENAYTTAEVYEIEVKLRSHNATAIMADYKARTS